MLSPDQLALLSDHTDSTYVNITLFAAGGHCSILVDLGPGRSLKPNFITFQKPVGGPTGTVQHHVRVEGFNRAGETPTRINNAGPIALPSVDGTWAGGPLDPSVGYRYIRFYGLDGLRKVWGHPLCPTSLWEKSNSTGN